MKQNLLHYTPEDVFGNGLDVPFRSIKIYSEKHGVKTIYFDASKWNSIKDLNWHLHKSRNTFYALASTHLNGKRIKVKMHRLILETPDDMITDHINGNGLDNRMSNLRICTNAENSRNIRMPRHNTSGYKGCSWHKGTGKFQASIRFMNKDIYLGLFNTPIEAAKAYNEAALRYHGEFASLNNIKEQHHGRCKILKV